MVIPPTINNIVINNYNTSSTMAAETVNAPVFKPSKLYFPPLEAVSQQRPTLE